MKKSIFLFLIGLPFLSISQYAEDLSLNNVFAIINNSTRQFQNLAALEPGYNIPKDSSTSVIYSSNVWIMGKKDNNQLVGSCNIYSHDHFGQGPIANNYNDSQYQAKYFTSLWSVNKIDIDYHKLHYNEPSYIIPSNILNWPGNGTIGNGEAATLAPFIDLNNDGIYSPQSGDYPCIKGDQAKYIILNDVNCSRTYNDVDSMSIELHIMIYQYETNDFLNETTFMEMSFFNRSAITYNDIYIGQSVEFDIGSWHDDAIGSDSSRNILYAYNSDLFDESSASSTGYKAYPPASGMFSLNHTTNSIAYFNNNGSISGNPQNGSDYMNYMKGLYKDGTPFLNSNSEVTKFRFNATDENDPDIFTLGTDVRGFLSTKHGSFLPGENINVHYAIPFARTKDSTRFSPVLELLKTTDSIQEFYDNNIVNCGALSIDENVQEFDFNVFPNPAIELVNIQVEGQFQIELLDSKGSLVFTKPNCFGQEQINVAPFEKGLYFIQVKTEKGIQSEKLMIK